MSVLDMNSRMAMAEKLSVQQLQQAVQSGSLPAYIGIPLIEQKNKEKAQMAAAQGGQEKPPSVAASILQQAEQQEQQEQGIDQLPSNLPIEGMPQGMAGGGIVAFAEGDVVEDPEEDPLITALRQDPLAQFSGLTPETLTADTARIEKIKADRAAAEEKQRREFLSRSAPHMLPPEAPSAIGEMQDPGGAAVAGIGIPVRGNRPGTGQGTQGAGNAPTARQTAQPSQAPAAQPEGQSALDKYAAMLMAEREGSGKERDKAKGMALLQAGLGIMGGTSPNAFANIAQGALPATQAYQQSIKGIRAEDSARLKELMGLGVSKEKLALEAKKLGISEKRFNQMYELETQKLGIMGGSRADAAKNAEALRRDQLAKGYFELLLKQNPMATESEQDVLRDRARAFAARDAGGTAPSPTNKYAGFSLVK